VVAEKHPDGGIDQLGRNPVQVLIGQAMFRIPPASPQLRKRTPAVVMSFGSLPAAARSPRGTGVAIPSMTKASPMFGRLWIRGAPSRYAGSM